MVVLFQRDPATGRLTWLQTITASTFPGTLGPTGLAVSTNVVDGYRPPRPEITITNAKGEVVQKGNFEYG